MPPTFPCPNPTCTHAFAPEAVKGASSLKCPRCGTVFQFGPSRPTPATTAATTKAPVAAPVAKLAAAPKAPPVLPRPSLPPAAVPVAPMAQPVVSPSATVAVPVAAVPTPSALNFNSTPDMVVPRARRQMEKKGKRRLAPLLAILAVVVLGLGVAVWGVLWLIHFNKVDKGGDDPTRAASTFNARFVQPGKPWRTDKDIQFKLHVHVGMRSAERNNCMGLFFKDYERRLPNDAEMMDEAINKLRAYFQGVEWELKPRDQQVQMGGRPALVLEFQGEGPEHVPMNGECYMLAYRGYAYWFFTWGPLEDKELVAPEWDGLRQQFTLLDGRKGWTETPRPSEIVQGSKANYRLTYVKGLWTRKVAADYDPLADLVLQGDEPDPERKKHSSKVATFKVLVLPKQADLPAAVASARKYLQESEEKEYPKTTMQPIKDKNGVAADRNTEIGKERGHLSKLLVQNAEDLERFMVVAVVNRPEGVLVLVGDCLWERRDYWDLELKPLINSLKVR